MREAADFTGYVDARWPAIVRSLVLLGCPEALAPDVGLSALARVRGGWARTLAADDVDAAVNQAVIEAWAERRRTPWWDQVDPVDADEPTVDRDLVAALDRLPGEVRERVVHAALGRDGAADPAPGLSAQALRDAAESVKVLAPPSLAAVAARDKLQRRRTTRRLLASAVPVLLVVAGLTWWATGSDEADELGPVAVRRAENAAPVAWYANGQLHLEHVILALPDASQVEQISGGAAYSDGQGRVVFVAADGTRTLLGRKDPDLAMVAADDAGWVGWVEPPGADPAGPHLVVRDLASGENLVDRPVVPAEAPAEVQLIAVDAGVLFYEDGAGTHALTVGSGLVLSGQLDDLVGAQAQTRVFQAADVILHVVQSSAVQHDLPGAGAQLSDDGVFLLTRAGSESLGPVRIYDTRTGRQVPSGVGDDDVVLVAEFGRDGSVNYIIARAADRPQGGAFLRSSFSGQLELRTCQLDTGSCEALERFPSTGSGPLLAR